MSTAPADQKRHLDDVLSDVAASPGALVVFDLDDTLFSTNDRHLRILREYADTIQSRAPQEAALLRAIDRKKMRYLITETVCAAGLDETLANDLREFWFARFFHNDYLLEDSVVAGAPEFCKEIAARGGRLVYVTGRDEAMRSGTEKSFAKHGFPLPDGNSARLILKPRFDFPDFAFKTESVKRLAALGSVIASFENEPGHVNLFRNAFPQARHFLLETKHSGKPVTVSPDALHIADFRR